MRVVSEKKTHLQRGLLENLKILLQLITLRFKRKKGLKSPTRHIMFQRKISHLQQHSLLSAIYVPIGRARSFFIRAAAHTLPRYANSFSSMMRPWKKKRSQVGCQQHSEAGAPFHLSGIVRDLVKIKQSGRCSHEILTNFTNITTE